MVCLSPEYEEDTSDTNSVIWCDSLSNLIMSYQKKVDNACKVTGSILSHTTENSTTHPKDKLSLDINALNVLPPKSNLEDLVH